MSDYYHKKCNGKILPHPNNDIAFCCICSLWIDEENFDQIYIKWNYNQGETNDQSL